MPRKPGKQLFLDVLVARAQDGGKGGLSLRGSHHDKNRRNRQNRHSRLLALYFVGQAKGGQGVLQTVRTAKAAMKATPLKLNPPLRLPSS